LLQETNPFSLPKLIDLDFKSVLSSILVFYLSLYKMFVVVLKKIERIQRNFLWRWGLKGGRLFGLLGKKICKSREADDLGILDLRVFNVALLEKWIWCLGTDKGDL